MIKEYFSKIIHRWKILLNDRAYYISLLIGIVFFSGCVFFLYFTGIYNDSIAYAPVGDLILDNIPTYNLSFLFVWGFYSLIAMMVFYCAFVKPELAPFTLKTFGILLVVRSCFMLFTHIGPPQGFYYDQIVLADNPLDDLFFRNDLFFSGHTAIPFLAFLLLKGTKFRWVMFAGSIVMGITVLLMHVHYSIDVFAAFFITHGIYTLSDRIFNRLNFRFSERIRLFGWKGFKKRDEDKF